jgi:hypothetical protein
MVKQQSIISERAKVMHEITGQLRTMLAAFEALNPNRVTADTLTNLADGAQNVATKLAIIAMLARGDEKCSCHSGSVCNVACDNGKHHSGCHNEK